MAVTCSPPSHQSIYTGRATYCRGGHTLLRFTRCGLGTLLSGEEQGQAAQLGDSPVACRGESLYRDFLELVVTFFSVNLRTVGRFIIRRSFSVCLYCLGLEGVGGFPSVVICLAGRFVLTLGPRPLLTLGPRHCPHTRS